MRDDRSNDERERLVQLESRVAELETNLGRVKTMVGITCLGLLVVGFPPVAVGILPAIYWWAMRQWMGGRSGPYRPVGFATQLLLLLGLVISVGVGVLLASVLHWIATWGI